MYHELLPVESVSPQRIDHLLADEMGLCPGACVDDGKHVVVSKSGNADAAAELHGEKIAHVEFDSGFEAVTRVSFSEPDFFNLAEYSDGIYIENYVVFQKRNPKNFPNYRCKCRFQR
ncbi:MAG: hypothetical protein R3B84_19935 [Zavarzinella sp.]